MIRKVAGSLLLLSYSLAYSGAGKDDPDIAGVDKWATDEGARLRLYAAVTPAAAADVGDYIVRELCHGDPAAAPDAKVAWLRSAAEARVCQANPACTDMVAARVSGLLDAPATSDVVGRAWVMRHIGQAGGAPKEVARRIEGLAPWARAAYAADIVYAHVTAPVLEILDGAVVAEFAARPDVCDDLAPHVAGLAASGRLAALGPACFAEVLRAIQATDADLLDAAQVTPEMLGLADDGVVLHAGMVARMSAAQVAAIGAELVPELRAAVPVQAVDPAAADGLSFDALLLSVVNNNLLKQKGWEELQDDVFAHAQPGDIDLIVRAIVAAGIVDDVPIHVWDAMLQGSPASCRLLPGIPRDVGVSPECWSALPAPARRATITARALDAGALATWGARPGMSGAVLTALRAGSPWPDVAASLGGRDAIGASVCAVVGKDILDLLAKDDPLVTVISQECFVAAGGVQWVLDTAGRDAVPRRVRMLLPYALLWDDEESFFAALTPEDVAKHVQGDFWRRVTAPQLNMMPRDAIAAISGDQAALLAPGRIDALSPERIAWLAPAAFAQAHVAPPTVARMTPAQISAARADLMAGATKEDISALSEAQRAALRGPQWADVPADAFVGLPSAAGIEPAAMEDWSRAQIEHTPAHVLAALSDRQAARIGANTDGRDMVADMRSRQSLVRGVWITTLVVTIAALVALAGFVAYRMVYHREATVAWFKSAWARTKTGCAAAWTWTCIKAAAFWALVKTAAVASWAWTRRAATASYAWTRTQCLRLCACIRRAPPAPE